MGKRNSCVFLEYYSSIIEKAGISMSVREISNSFGKILKIYSRLEALDLKKLEGIDRLGNLNFQIEITIIESVILLLKPLSYGNITNIKVIIPDSTIDELYKFLVAFDAKVGDIERFNLQMNNSGVIWQNIRNDLQNVYGQLFPTLSTLSYIITKNLDPLQEAQVNANDILSQVKDILKEIEKDKEAANSLLDSQKQLTAKTGIVAYASYFENEATQHEKDAAKWRWATILIAIGALGLSGYFYFKPIFFSDNISQWIIIAQALSARVIALAVIFYMLIWAAKNFSANKHNVIVNRHRGNALKSFEAFVKATDEDSTTKNAVLLQATQCIFSAQNSGYSTKETESISPLKFIEIFKDTTKMG